MRKIQIYLREEELDALRQAASRSGRSVAEIVRQAIRQSVLMPAGEGPVALWDGAPNAAATEHDSIYDEP